MTQRRTGAVCRGGRELSIRSRNLESQAPAAPPHFPPLPPASTASKDVERPPSLDVTAFPAASSSEMAFSSKTWVQKEKGKVVLSSRGGDVNGERENSLKHHVLAST